MIGWLVDKTSAGWVIAAGHWTIGVYAPTLESYLQDCYPVSLLRSPAAVYRISTERSGLWVQWLTDISRWDRSEAGGGVESWMVQRRTWLRAFFLYHCRWHCTCTRPSLWHASPPVCINRNTQSLTEKQELTEIRNSTITELLATRGYSFPQQLPPYLFGAVYIHPLWIHSCSRLRLWIADVLSPSPPVELSTALYFSLSVCLSLT